MYFYTMQAMPGEKAKFDGDTSVKYQIKRKHTPAPPDHKSVTVVIRTGLGYSEAAELVKRFNEQERERRAIKREEAHSAH
ncbi:MAG TPA: hypothetical protein VER08_09100 [Pyrinomonadaceae bacterium]|nr:hypothetical protein [Pyrinomonadaceae bacterium]